ncbi:MAG: hypothetical protein OEY63_03585 [Gemmatimonadota bacterium]|nr:hypothetical protein [Gemmatimonadota bacterium]
MNGHIAKRGSIPSAMAWMVGLSVALFWLPVLGGLIAGYVGGSRAGSLGRAVAAVFLPGILMAVLGVVLGGILGSIPIIGGIFGMIAGLGGAAVGAMNIVPLLIGAVVGGWLSEKPV